MIKNWILYVSYFTTFHIHISLRHLQLISTTSLPLLFRDMWVGVLIHVNNCMRIGKFAVSLTRLDDLHKTVPHRSQLPCIQTGAQFKAEESKLISRLTVNVGKLSVDHHFHPPCAIFYSIVNEFTLHSFLKNKNKQNQNTHLLRNVPGVETSKTYKQSKLVSDVANAVLQMGTRQLQAFWFINPVLGNVSQDFLT